MDIKILVATHKKYWMPNDDVYLPIHVGREGKEDLGYMGDNTGENISNKNANYCELTGLYWAWKNLEFDYIGLCHYRRYFSTIDSIGEVEVYKNFDDVGKYILKRKECEQLLKDYDIILPKKYFMERLTVYEQYKKYQPIKDLDECYIVIKKLYPEYKEAFENVMNRRYFYICNMFISNKEYFNKYIEWLFNILIEVEKHIDITNYDDRQKRVFGYLSERLFNVWLEKESFKAKELTMFMIRNVDMIKFYRHKIKKLFK